MLIDSKQRIKVYLGEIKCEAFGQWSFIMWRELDPRYGGEVRSTIGPFPTEQEAERAQESIAKVIRG